MMMYISSFVLQAAIDGYKVIRILNIGIFVLVYWIFKAKIKPVIQMKNLEGKVLLINATYRAWPKVSNFWTCIFDRLMRYLFLL